MQLRPEGLPGARWWRRTVFLKSGQVAHVNAKGAGWCQRKIILSCLWIVLTVGDSSWRLEDSKYVSYLQQQQERILELQTSQPPLGPWKGDWEIILESVPKHMRGKKVIGIVSLGFKRQIIAFYNEVTSLLDDWRVVHVINFDFFDSFWCCFPEQQHQTNRQSMY